MSKNQDKQKPHRIKGNLRNRKLILELPKKFEVIATTRQAQCSGRRTISEQEKALKFKI